MAWINSNASCNRWICYGTRWTIWKDQWVLHGWDRYRWCSHNFIEQLDNLFNIVYIITSKEQFLCIPEIRVGAYDSTRQISFWKSSSPLFKIWFKNCCLSFSFCQLKNTNTHSQWKIKNHLKLIKLGLRVSAGTFWKHRECSFTDIKIKTIISHLLA